MDFFLIADVCLILALLLYITFNFVNITRTEVPKINSSDDNIASALIEKSMISFLEHFKLSGHYDVVYSKTYIKSIFSNHKKNNKIIIPQVLTNSVGYELDWIFANLWTTIMLIKKDSQIRYFKFLIFFLPLFFLILFGILALGSIGILIFYKTNPQPFETFGLNYLRMILGAITIVMTISLLALPILHFSSLSVKTKMEDRYEKDLKIFVKKELHNYHNDILSARIYSRSIKYMLYPVFKINKHFSNYKFISPFVLY